MADYKVQVLISAKDAASAVLKGMEGPVGSLEARLRIAGEAAAGFGQKYSASMAAASRVGQGMVAGGAGLAAGFVLAGKAATEFNRGLDEVSTLVDTTQVSMAGLKGAINGIAADTGQAAASLTRSLYQALSAGVAAGDAPKFMGVAARAAVAGVTDAETAVNGLTTAINSWGLKSSDAGMVADAMFNTVKAGKTTFGELSASLFNVGPAASAAGVSLQETMAAMSTLTAAGVPTSVAANNIRAALVGLMRPSKEMDAIFQQLGFRNAEAAVKANGFKFALDAVMQASGGSSGTLTTLLGSVEAVQAAQVLAGTGSAKFAADIQAQGNAAGDADKAFQKMAAGSAAAFARARESAQAAFRGIGDAVLPMATKVVNAITPIIKAIGKMAESPLGRVFLVAAAAGSVLLIALGGLLIAIGKVAMSVVYLRQAWDGVTTAAGKAALAQTAATTAARATPAARSPLLEDAAPLVAGAVDTSWDAHFRNLNQRRTDSAWGGHFANLRAKFGGPPPAATNAAANAVPEVKAAMSAWASQWAATKLDMAAFGAGIKALPARIIAGFKGIWAGLKTAIAAIGTGLKAAFAAITSPIGIVVAAIVALGIELKALLGSYRTMREAQKQAAQASEDFADAQRIAAEQGYVTPRQVAREEFGITDEEFDKGLSPSQSAQVYDVVRQRKEAVKARIKAERQAQRDAEALAAQEAQRQRETQMGDVGGTQLYSAESFRRAQKDKEMEARAQEGPLGAAQNYKYQEGKVKAELAAMREKAMTAGTPEAIAEYQAAREAAGERLGAMWADLQAKIKDAQAKPTATETGGAVGLPRNAGLLPGKGGIPQLKTEGFVIGGAGVAAARGAASWLGTSKNDMAYGWHGGVASGGVSPYGGLPIGGTGSPFAIGQGGGAGIWSRMRGGEGAEGPLEPIHIDLRLADGLIAEHAVNAIQSRAGRQVVVNIVRSAGSKATPASAY